MKFLNRFCCISLLPLTLFTAFNTYAGVVIGGTRVIYKGEKKEASLSVNNVDRIAYLIQSWIDAPNGDGTKKAPFIITPPLYRLDPGQQNVMRIVRAGNIPEDKESMYWLNIKAIPSAEKRDNTLQIAVKTRIKLIFRPESLKGATPESQADKLVWQKTGNQLQVKNPSAYYINFNEIALGGKKLKDVTYVAPGATATFPLPSGADSHQLTFKVISDFGGAGAQHNVSL